jgi:hypothetical protein
MNKLFLVLVAVGLIFFLSLEADAKKTVSKEGRKEKIGNQLVVEKERMTKMKTVNETGLDEKSSYGDDKCVDEDQDHDKDGEDEDDEDGESEEDGDDGNDEDGDEENDDDGEDGEDGTGYRRLAKRGDVKGPAQKRPRKKPQIP